jgi:hypothetical protein
MIYRMMSPELSTISLIIVEIFFSAPTIFCLFYLIVTIISVFKYKKLIKIKNLSNKEKEKRFYKIYTFSLLHANIYVNRRLAAAVSRWNKKLDMEKRSI